MGVPPSRNDQKTVLDQILDELRAIRSCPTIQAMARDLRRIQLDVEMLKLRLR